ncbi:MAG TPA: type II toxin-antitoxin system prevent-host-death family antitoxin [Gemmatimonadaceae bacterium]|jgi:prevent-host-death family protein|nr:type II toxin-antitoxin system prevent-host-death family antitoxin [Gemmatimonadaceae bacterium]
MPTPLRIPASQFKARCLQLMKDVQQTGQDIVITNHDRPIAQLSPVREAAAQGHFGAMRGMIRVTGDLDTPVLDPNSEARWLAAWDAKLTRGK